MTGAAADSAREAESLRRDGNPQTAVMLLEEALAASERVDPELPGWLCGRLAALYRTIGRYDDEVLLLERYRESQSSEEARSRYDARLSKARTIAERKRRPDSGALLSVRKVLGTPRRRGNTPPGGMPAVPDTPVISASWIARLAALLGEGGARDLTGRLDGAIAEFAGSARESGMPVEQAVATLRVASRHAAATTVDDVERERRFSLALVSLLAAYYEER